MPIDPRLIPTPQDPTSRLMQRLSDQDARLSALERNRKGAILDVFHMEGANNNWVSAGSGSPINIYTDAGGTVPLRWTYTPVVDAWVEVGINCLRWQSGTAAWFYSDLRLVITPAPALGVPATHLSRVYDHSGASGGGATSLTNVIVPVSAGVQYEFLAQIGGSGGATWVYYAGSGWLWLDGKAWAR